MGRPLLFDGATGTYLASKRYIPDGVCELLDLTEPELVLETHREYIAAGAQAIKTNTFRASPFTLGRDRILSDRVIDAGCAIALKAADGKARVFADIGPLPDETPDARTELAGMLDRFIANGLTDFLFETFPAPEHALWGAGYVKEKLGADSFVIVSFAIAPDGYTAAGFYGGSLLDMSANDPSVDICGFNCVSGPAHLLELTKRLRNGKKPMSVMPNVGYPSREGARTVFNADPDYFAGKLYDICMCGVPIVGGCCGTTPEHIAAAAKLINSIESVPEPPVRGGGAESSASSSELLTLLRSGKKVVAVELDPPRDIDAGKFLASVPRLCDADILTIADCPVGRARVDSSMLAAKLKRDFGVLTMPHMTCRDRNLNATKALLMGLAIEGIHNVLLVTGDPIPQADRSEIKSVFNLNSERLANYVNQLNSTLFASEPFTICAALNVNAANFDRELERAAKKRASGVSVFFTQPVFTDRAKQNLRAAKQRLAGAFILCGLMPLVSFKNASFIRNELSGIDVPEELVKKYEGLDRAAAEKLGEDTCVGIAEEVSGFADGYYIVTPFGRVELVRRMITRLPR